eukprot:549485-Pyramimonas_sp.AAC.1
MGAVPLGHTSPIHSATPVMIGCLHSPGGRYTFSSNMRPRPVSTRSASAPVRVCAGCLKGDTGDAKGAWGVPRTR